jgi:hypothetical protein
VDAAKRLTGEGQASVSFSVGDIRVISPARYDAVLCRGVLNDIVDDDVRDAVFEAFTRGLRPGGVLVLDVREWEATAARKAREPVFRKRVSTDRGELTFTSVTTLDPDHQMLLVSERHALIHDGRERVADYRFVMRCWTRDELHARLTRCGFDRVAYFGAYDVRIAAGATDRLVAVARLPASPARHARASHGA